MPGRLLRWLSLALLLAACGIPPQPNASERTLPSPPPASINPVAPASAAAASAAPPSPASVAPSPSPSAAPRAAVPKELIIPVIQVIAPVERVGVTADGAMDVPKEWNDVGWFEKGFRPGERGSAVIAGHLDSPTDRAVFWDLHQLKAGDKVLVKADDGSQRTFQVVGSEVYAFNQAPLDRIFGPSDAPMLNLVTCNGTFDRGSKNYDKRLVVFTKESR